MFYYDVDETPQEPNCCLYQLKLVLLSVILPKVAEPIYDIK